ncbi:MAG: molybdenum cofactor cytidylyltransferase [Thermodesulfobacteriota bacterium]
MISAILLAAGESKRMGVNKLLLPWGGKTVLEHCLDVLLRSNVGEVVIVLREPSNEIRERLKKSSVLKNKMIKVVVNRQFKKGMSTSIQSGLRRVDPRSHGILIALGDQPLLQTRTVDALLRAFGRESGEIVVPAYRGRKGHPVIFHRRFRGELSKLRGEAGGRSVLDKYPGSVRFVRVKSEGVLRDIDTWKDYQNELEAMRKKRRWEETVRSDQRKI